MHRTRTQPSPLQRYSKTNSHTFKQKATTLLSQIQNLHLQLQSTRQQNFKSFLQDIANLDHETNEETKLKNILYEELLERVLQLQEQVQEEVHAGRKCEMQVRARLEGLSKANQRMFQKLKYERAETQQRLQNYLNEQLKALTKRTPLNTPKHLQQSPYHSSFQKIRHQIHNFFQQAQTQQQRVKKQIFCMIEQCTQGLQDKQTDNFQSQVMEYMRIIHIEIENRVRKLADDRERVEKDVLNLLETVLDASTRKHIY